VREYAESLGIDDETALRKGMQEKSEEFKKAGADIYVREVPS
jgi:phosphomethylpyrimidine synthase